MTQFLIPADLFDDWTFSAFADMDRLFQSANIKFPLSNVLVEKESGTMVIELALAGYSVGDISITAEDSSIIVEGKAQVKADGYTIIYQDIKQSAFKQRIPISSKFDLTKIEPRFVNGILSIKIPVSEERKPKRIEIK